MLAFAALLLLLSLEPLFQLQFAFAAKSIPKTLNITTIAANPQKQSILECWRLNAPLLESSVPGTSGSVFAQLGQGNATSYGLIPPHFDGGLHNAPAIQWVWILLGACSFQLSWVVSNNHRAADGSRLPPAWLWSLFPIHQQKLRYTVEGMVWYSQLTLLASVPMVTSPRTQAIKKQSPSKYHWPTTLCPIIQCCMKGLVGRKNRTITSNDGGRTSWSIGDGQVLLSRISKAQPMYIEHAIIQGDGAGRK